MKKLFVTSICSISLLVGGAQTNSLINKSESSAQKSNRPTVEVRAERSSMRMKNDLNLSNDQYTKLYDLKLAKYKEIEEVRAKYATDEQKDARKDSFRKIRDTYKTSLKTFLTADQYTKWEEFIKVKRDRLMKGYEQQPNSKPADEEAVMMQVELD